MEALNPKPISPHLILSTTGFTKVSDRRQFCVDGTPVKPTIVQLADGFFSVFFTVKL